MSEKLKQNLQVIKKYHNNIIATSSNVDVKAMNSEFKEWIEDSFNGNEYVWTLPDLTRTELLNNFCRSIKKKII